MQLTLSDDDARTLRDFLRDCLHDYQFEVARTEVRDFRHLMVSRQELLQRLLAQLEQQVQV